MFLHVVALMLRAEDFDAATYLLSEPYYMAANVERGHPPLATYTAIRQHTSSLVSRNKRLGLRRLSLRADLLHQRAQASGTSFEDIMEADFVCFLRADLSEGARVGRWWPETLLYAERRWGPFEIFARCASTSYLNRVLPLLGVSDLAELRSKVEQYGSGTRQLPRWEWESFSPVVLLGLEQLGTIP
jgi:hypothetical protein